MAAGNKREKDKKDRKKVSLGGWAKEQGTSERTASAPPKGVTLFNPKKPGVYRLEIIPYTVGKGNPRAGEGDLHVERTFWVHPRIGPNLDSYVCLAKTTKNKCPVCEHLAKLNRDPEVSDEEKKALRPKERQLWNVYDHAEPDKGVQVWDVSPFLFGNNLASKINNADPDDKEQYENFADPEEGMTVRVVASEKSMGAQKFLEFDDIEFKPRKEALDPDLFDTATNLDECVKILSYEELKKIFHQEGGDEDEDEDEKPATGKAGAKKPVVNDDDDDDDDEEKKPKGSGKKPAAKDDDDEEKPSLKKGMAVKFEYKGKTLKGVIKKLDEDNEIAHVLVGDEERARMVDFEDLEPVKQEDEDTETEDDDEKPATRKDDGKKPVANDDDDDDFDNDDDDSDLDVPQEKTKGGKRGK